jgi:hypothetical protein
VRILRRKTEKKTVEVLGEGQFRFRRGKGTRDAGSENNIIIKLRT